MIEKYIFSKEESEKFTEYWKNKRKNYKTKEK